MDEYDRTASRLTTLFCEDFKEYEDGVSTEIKSAGPVVVVD